MVLKEIIYRSIYKISRHLEKECFKDEEKENA